MELAFPSATVRAVDRNDGLFFADRLLEVRVAGGAQLTHRPRVGGAITSAESGMYAKYYGDVLTVNVY